MTNLNIQIKKDSGNESWVPEREAQPVRSDSRLYLAPVALAVILAHAALFSLLLTQTSQKEITLVAAPAAAVRVTMSSPPPPEPETPVIPPPEETAVLKAKEAERTVAEQKPVPPKPKPEPPKPRPKPKPVPSKPKEEPKPVVEDAPAPKPIPEQPVVAEKTLDLPSSGPKDVQTVGCRVPTPEYPRKARRLKEQGTVLVSMVIDPSGKVQSATVARTSGSAELDQAARQAVLGAACAPYMEGGRAISVRAAQPINFSLTR